MRISPRPSASLPNSASSSECLLTRGTTGESEETMRRLRTLRGTHFPTKSLGGVLRIGCRRDGSRERGGRGAIERERTDAHTSYPRSTSKQSGVSRHVWSCHDSIKRLGVSYNTLTFSARGRTGGGGWVGRHEGVRRKATWVAPPRTACVGLDLGPRLSRGIEPFQSAAGRNFAKSSSRPKIPLCAPRRFEQLSISVPLFHEV